MEIPTNQPDDPQGLPGLSSTRPINGKYNAVIEQIMECHENGQPVLVGTVSIEKSETARQDAQAEGHPALTCSTPSTTSSEAEIVAQAGKMGAVTIATNMAGRGTDIMLGGNAEYLAKAEMRKASGVIPSEEL